jgi:hypothetical protein
VVARAVAAGAVAPLAAGQLAQSPGGQPVHGVVTDGLPLRVRIAIAGEAGSGRVVDYGQCARITFFGACPVTCRRGPVALGFADEFEVDAHRAGAGGGGAGERDREVRWKSLFRRANELARPMAIIGIRRVSRTGKRLTME